MPFGKSGKHYMNPKMAETMDNAPEAEPEPKGVEEAPADDHGKMVSAQVHPDNKGGFNVSANYHHEKHGAHQMNSHHASKEEAGEAMMEHMAKC